MAIFTNVFNYLQTKKRIRKESNLPLPWITWGLSILLLLIYYLQVIYPSITIMFNLDPASAQAKYQIYRIITASFLHLSWLHVISNVVVLFLIGWRLERLLGHVRYAVIYLVASVFASLFSLTFLPDVTTVGASGGIYGLEVLTIVMFIAFFKNTMVRAFISWWQLLYSLISIIFVIAALRLLHTSPLAGITIANNYCK